MQTTLTKSALALGVAAAAAICAASVLSLNDAGDAGGAAIGGAPAPAKAAQGRVQRYIVLYKDAPLSTYQGGVQGLPAPRRLRAHATAATAAGSGASAAAGEGRIDVASADARAYVDYLGARQSAYEQRIGRALGRVPRIERHMRHAVNGVVAEMSAPEAAKVAALADVRLVEEYREYPLATDVGPALIGAPALWNATPSAYRGEGTVVGILDSGINFGSPSFAGTDETGYRHVNPLGAGRYLGTCAPGGPDEGRCNDKLIGGYDFVCAGSENLCGKPDIREEPGFGDSNGHGSHVAGIAAGNVRTAAYRGRDLHISGVAPHANIVAFDVCYSTESDGRGWCSNTAIVQAVDQAAADGVVDVLNFSITGGGQPWGEAVSLSFLNATDAGIYVAAAAGNSGPAAGTSQHLAPWVGTTAATTHGRGDFSYVLQLIAPAPVPPPLQTVLLTEGTSGTAFSASLPASTPLRVSAGIGAADDGCAAFPAGAFQDAIAVLRRGTCGFAVKANNAAAAGAKAVVVANNAAGGVVPNAAGATIPMFSVSQADGDAIAAFAAGTGNAGSAAIAYPPTPIPNVPDVLAAFSGRGSGRFDLIKPDLAAPGVSIMAPVSGTRITGYENDIGLKSGTSMASPHHAGAALLVRQAQPGWSVSEVKSALMTTAVEEVFKDDTVTRAGSFDTGTGRVQVDRAVKAGLVLDETTANYRAADPAAGGDPSKLNLASMAKGKCVNSCTFVRTFRNVLSTRQSWVLNVEGLSALTLPSLLTLAPGESRAVRVTVVSAGFAKDGAWHFGRLALTPLGGNTALPVLRLPIAVAVPPPRIALTPNQVALSLPAGGTGTVAFAIGNSGDSSLDYRIDNTGAGTRTQLDAARGTVNSGFLSTYFTDPAAAGFPAQFAADDFTLGENARIARLYSEGFVMSNRPLAASSTGLTWTIYRDSGGNPDGNPQTSPGNAVWSYTAAPTAAGVAIDGANIGLDLAAAGQNLELPPGRYWLVVHSRSSYADRWVWYASNTGDNAFRGITPRGDGSGGWTPTFGFAGMAFKLQVANACGAPWIGLPARAFGRIGAGASADNRVTISARGLSPGQYAGYVCVGSDDPLQPKVALRVALTVVP